METSTACVAIHSVSTLARDFCLHCTLNLKQFCLPVFHFPFLSTLLYFVFITVTSNSTPCRRHPFHARLISNNRVTAADHWQDVRLVQFDIKGSGMRYTISHRNSSKISGVCNFSYNYQPISVMLIPTLKLHVRLKQWTNEQFSSSTQIDAQDICN